MTEPYFQTLERRRVLRRVALSWIGTPFRPHGRDKGIGVDCVSLAAGIYLETGCIQSYDPPWYSMDGGSHLERSQLEAEVVKTGRFALVWEREPARAKQLLRAAELDFIQPGDLLFFRLGRVVHHCAVCVGDFRVIQALHTSGVCWGHIADPTLSRRLEAVYRP